MATYMLSSGVPIAEISAWLGHKSVMTTSNIYAHVTDDMRKDTARWMDSDYTPNGPCGNTKITLEKAIQKLFENVLDQDEGSQVKQEEISQLDVHKLKKYRENSDKQERNGEQGDNMRFRVTRGNCLA